MKFCHVDAGRPKQIVERLSTGLFLLQESHIPLPVICAAVWAFVPIIGSTTCRDIYIAVTTG